MEKCKGDLKSVKRTEKLQVELGKCKEDRASSMGTGTVLGELEKCKGEWERCKGNWKTVRGTENMPGKITVV